MIKKITIALFVNCITLFCFSQSTVDSLLRQGNNSYNKREFGNAATTWEKAAELAEYKISKQMYYFYTSLAFASANDSTNSFRSIEIAVNQFGFNNKPALKSENAFEFMKQSNRWVNLMKSIKPVFTTDPSRVEIIDKDVTNFWKAYDQVNSNPTKANEIYKTEYIDKGTIALQFYYVNKIKTIDRFVNTHNVKKKYYSSIRENTFRAKQLKPTYQKSFVKLSEIYPDATFPPIYFVIGRLNSGGTVSSDGLILALDQACMSSTLDTSELSNWEKQNISTIDNLPHTVAHELIHYEQGGMASDTTLLRAAIIEGMADFIGEIISGKTANERLYVFAKGKEKSIWADFAKEMHLNKASNWIANSNQETADKPADLGYWVGYQICKAYYSQSPDKKKAISDMLHIQDYKKFLEESKIEGKFK